MADKEEKIATVFKILYFLCISGYVCAFKNLDIESAFRTRRSVVEFDANALPNFVSGRDSEIAIENFHNLHKRDVGNCDSSQVTELSSDVNKVHTFINESKTAMALAWAGENDGTLIVVTSESSATFSSSVFRSTDYGVTYENLTRTQNIDEVIKKHNGLQRHPLDPKRVYLVGEAKILYMTTDGGVTFVKINLPFLISGELIFHTDARYTDHIMAMHSKDLYLSKDNGRSWTMVKRGVDKAMWGVLPGGNAPPVDSPDTPTTIYYTYGAMDIDDMILQHFLDIGLKKDYVLARSTDGGDTSKDILKKVVSFERHGRFLFASTVRDDKSDWRTLMVSIDCGTKFYEAQLPTIEPTRFYKLVDIEESMIFMHVDNPGDTGHGTLYTSARKGVVFSESLPRHLYPNYNTIHDFYKVKSMRGVFITSQMSDDDSIHTMISYNFGATWSKIPRPDNAPCKDEKKECNLHLHGMYSMNRRINAALPISEKTAVGLIVAHGHVADALQRTDPDVFVSSDGGYNWALSLKGPHHYQIGDHGGLIVAVSKSEPSPKIIKFSTDEGRCWKEYKFTDKTLNFTGLLTEPEGKSSVVMLWGYVSESKKWEVHVIDFAKVINRQCGDDDYEVWLAHSVHNTDKGAKLAGCMLGLQETFYRLKKNSVCYNGHEHEVTNKSVTCECTREDYECDYGYYRPGGSENCVKEPEFTGPEIDICLRGHEEKLVSDGYRKIPGDKCVNGYHPSSKVIDMKEQCDQFSQNVVKEDEAKPTPPPESDSMKEAEGFSRSIKIVAVLLVIIVMILATIMGVYFVRKFILLRKHKTGYRYSSLSQSEQHQNLMDDDDDDNEGDLARDLDKAFATSTVKYDSDEELTTNSRPPANKTAQNGRIPKTTVLPKPIADTNPFSSYHDDSDDDMLS